MTRVRTDLLDRSLSGCPCRTGVGVRRAVVTDLRRCRALAQRDGKGSAVTALLRALLFYPGIYGVAAYRLSHAALHSRLPAPLNTGTYVVALLLQRMIIMITRVEISAQAHIGLGMMVNHAQGAVVGPVSAGSNLTVSHNATLGRGAHAEDDPDESSADATNHSSAGGCPVLGDRVWIGVGAVVIGGIRIGDDAMVGANSVVSRDLPARAVAAGAPARIRSRLGSFGYVVYPGMDTDPERLLSYAQRTAATDPSRGTMES